MHPARGARHFDRHADDLNRLSAGLFDRYDHLACCKVRIVSYVGDVHYRTERNDAAQPGRQLRLREARGVPAERLDQGRAMFDPQLRGCITWLGQDVLGAQGSAEQLEEALLMRGQRYEAVSCWIGAKRHEERMVIPFEYWRQTLNRMLIDRSLAEREHRIHHGDIHELSLAGPARVMHGGQYAEGQHRS